MISNVVIDCIWFREDASTKFVPRYCGFLDSNTVSQIDGLQAVPPPLSDDSSDDVDEEEEEGGDEEMEEKGEERKKEADIQCVAHVSSLFIY